MTLDQAVEIAIERSRTGEFRHERYRWLCSDANPDLESREAYRRLVFSLATGEPPAPAPARPPARIPLAQSLRATRLGFRRCWYSSHEGCGCSGTHCYHQARIVGLQDCVTCLSPLASNSR